jgi:HSP20 family protein
MIVCKNAFGKSFLDSFDEFFTQSWAPTTITNIKNRGIPATNIKEDDDGWDVELATPGVDKRNFSIQLEDKHLKIDYKEEDFDEDEADNYTKREFVYSAFTKTFIIPDDVDRNKITSKYEDGILKLNLPKDKAKIKDRIKKIKIT